MNVIEVQIYEKGKFILNFLCDDIKKLSDTFRQVSANIIDSKNIERYLKYVEQNNSNSIIKSANVNNTGIEIRTRIVH